MPIQRSIKENDKTILLSWASDCEEATIQQALRTARLPFVAGHVALQADAHVGMGATIGSVIPTEDAIIPSAVGLDIGCGMAAVLTNLTANDLPDDLDSFLPAFTQAIPAGVGKGHQVVSTNAYSWIAANKDKFSPLVNDKLLNTALTQYGSLGSGNHFFEICLDEQQRVWIVLHSGSRGLGNKLGAAHIKIAERLMQQWHIKLEDKALAYLPEQTTEFDSYINDMLLCQQLRLG